MAVAVEGAREALGPGVAYRGEAIARHVDVVLQPEVLAVERLGVERVGTAIGLVGIVVHLVGQQDEVVEGLDFPRVGLGALTLPLGDNELRDCIVEVGSDGAVEQLARVVLVGAQHDPVAPGELVAVHLAHNGGAGGLSCRPVGRQGVEVAHRGAALKHELLVDGERGIALEHDLDGLAVVAKVFHRDQVFARLGHHHVPIIIGGVARIVDVLDAHLAVGFLYLGIVAGIHDVASIFTALHKDGPHAVERDGAVVVDRTRDGRVVVGLGCTGDCGQVHLAVGVVGVGILARNRNRLLGQVDACFHVHTAQPEVGNQDRVVAHSRNLGRAASGAVGGDERAVGHHAFTRQVGHAGNSPLAGRLACRVPGDSTRLQHRILDHSSLLSIARYLHSSGVELLPALLHVDRSEINVLSPSHRCCHCSKKQKQGSDFSHKHFLHGGIDFYSSACRIGRRAPPFLDTLPSCQPTWLMLSVI